MPVGSITNRPPVGTVGAALAPRKAEPSENFRFITARHDKVLEYQLGLGRWIMASLLLVNGGALVAILNATDRYATAISAGDWFVVGVVAALLSGTFAWINCNLITIAADEFLDWENLDVQESSLGRLLHKWAVGMAILAVTASIVSLVCFPLGAAAVHRAIEATPAVAPSTAPLSSEVAP
jgi:hypothetical protein